MIVSFREQERRSTGLHRLDDVITDTAISRLVADQIAVKRLKFDSLCRRSPASLSETPWDEQERYG
jgi:hypothetical protein